MSSFTRRIIKRISEDPEKYHYVSKELRKRKHEPSSGDEISLEVNYKKTEDGYVKDHKLKGRKGRYKRSGVTK